FHAATPFQRSASTRASAQGCCLYRSPCSPPVRFSQKSWENALGIFVTPYPGGLGSELPSTAPDPGTSAPTGASTPKGADGPSRYFDLSLVLETRTISSIRCLHQDRLGVRTVLFRRRKVGLLEAVHRLRHRGLKRHFFRSVARIGNGASTLILAGVRLGRVEASAVRTDQAIDRMMEMGLRCLHLRRVRRIAGVGRRGRDFLRGIGGECNRSDAEKNGCAGDRENLLASHERASVCLVVKLAASIVSHIINYPHIPSAPAECPERQ